MPCASARFAPRDWPTVGLSSEAGDFLVRYLLELQIGPSAAPPARARASRASGAPRAPRARIAMQQIMDHLQEGPETLRQRDRWFQAMYSPMYYGTWAGDIGLWRPGEILFQAASGRAIRTAAVCCRAPSAPEAIAQFPPVSRSYRAPEMRMWSLARQYYTAVAQQRIVRTMLALALYRADHNALPESLRDLVPVYLPELPADPFDPDKQPLRYIARAQSFALYSVGQDGRDDHPASANAVGLGEYSSTPDLGVWMALPTAAVPATSPADSPTTRDSQ